MPPLYFGTSLTGIQIDQRVLRQLIAEKLPSIDSLLSSHDIGNYESSIVIFLKLLKRSKNKLSFFNCRYCHVSELSLISIHWFITLFAGVVKTKVLLRIWDHFFLDGSIVFFKVALGLLKLRVLIWLLHMFSS